jgi:hypothetical protein
MEDFIHPDLLQPWSTPSDWRERMAPFEPPRLPARMGRPPKPPQEPVDPLPFIRVIVDERMPPGRILVASDVDPEEVLPGETLAEAYERLGRAIVIDT